MNIRIEQPQDYREVENLTREAFWNVYRPGCTEHYVLNQYRNNPDFIPELDFVMEEGDGEHQSPGKIIGHVMFSKAEECADAPFSVVQGETLLMADVGEVVNHRDAEELVAPLSDDGTTPSDDDLREVVVKGYAGVAESH